MATNQAFPLTQTDFDGRTVYLTRYHNLGGSVFLPTGQNPMKENYRGSQMIMELAQKLTSNPSLIDEFILMDITPEETKSFLGGVLSYFRLW